jgi:uncharacterized protein (TIGR00251 family)
MIYRVRVIPKASRNLVKEDGANLKVYVHKPAQDGLANKQLLDLLADHFQVKKYAVKIIKGRNSRQKLVEINNP